MAFRRYGKKRSTFRKKVYRRPARAVMRSKAPRQKWSPLGTRRVIKHTYVQEITLNAGASAAADYVFSANGMFDPDATGSGHQPYAFDQMTTMFDHYTVVGSKCTVTCATNNAFPFWFGVELLADSTTETGGTASEMLERPGMARSAKLTGVTGTTGALQVVRGFSAKKFFGKQEIVGEADYRGNNAANPDEQAYFHVQIAPQGSNDLDNQTFMVKIEYTAVWTEPRKLDPS